MAATMLRQLFVFAAVGILLANVSMANAEHRVALVINNSGQQNAAGEVASRDVGPLVTGLKKLGFQCQVVESLDETKLRTTCEEFARRTPVRGTAVLCFSGVVQVGTYRGQQGLCLAGTNSRQGNGYLVELILKQLDAQGGSTNQIVFLDSKGEFDSELDLPERSLLAIGDGSQLVRQLEKNGDLFAAFAAIDAHVESSFPKATALAVSDATVVGPFTEFRPGRKVGDEWVNSRGMVFCWCPPGRFRTATPVIDGSGSEEKRDVSIAEGFWISKYEVTLAQWRGNRNGRSIAKHKLHPVNMASQSKDTKAREINALTKSQRAMGALPNDWEYALPTEDQWEYAARAGTNSTHYFGDDIKLLPLHANFADKSSYDSLSIYSNYAHRTLDDGQAGLAEVGLFSANPWGLHDVYGNVAEWCDNAVVRGGSWVSVTECCNSTYRDKRGDRDQEPYIGSRFVIRKTQ